MLKRHRNYFIFAAIVLFIVGWSILMTHFSPREIIAYIGADNSLIVAFLASTFGGISSLTAGSYYAMIVTFSSGGVNPWLLGIATGAGLTVSDSLVYYLGTRGHEVLTGKWKERANRLARWINNQHEHVVQIFAYVYTGLSPMPNDLLTVSLGLAKYSYKRLLPALLLGNITLSIIIAEFALRSNIVEVLFG
jgi:membrane protein YqaA with SNARE-associated domain